MRRHSQNITFLSGNLLALLKSIRSSNKKTCRRHFLPFPCQTKNSFCRNNLPCSFTFTYEIVLQLMYIRVYSYYKYYIYENHYQRTYIREI